MTQGVQITELTCKKESVKVCDSILSALPDWFGPYDVYKDYLDDLATRPVFVAQTEREIVGIMVLTKTTDASMDIHLLAIRPDDHGKGTGRTFVEFAKEYARSNGSNYLTVKTLGPSRENAAYAKTRSFYATVGFEPLEEFLDFWGEGFPMLLQCQKISH
ncbi:GNAT family N-acetyltransferase [Maritalea sp.]|uniref:GNAT family N-acetyltransferase n=1 Tax=Maritalea sp. TaxID=2003361 RepID=UPI003EF9DF3E